jgi:hypothetical protein
MALPPTGIYHPPVGAMTEVLRRRAIIAESWYNFFYLSVFFDAISHFFCLCLLSEVWLKTASLDLCCDYHIEKAYHDIILPVSFNSR